MTLKVDIPVEVIGRILSFVLASPSDDPQKLPTARPHPVSVLLVCKGLTRALLPHFYRSIHVFKPRDWYTLFNPVYGVLGLDEAATPPNERRFPLWPLGTRLGWVRELFLGLTDDSCPVFLPLDVAWSNDPPAHMIWDAGWDVDGGKKAVDDLIRVALPDWFANNQLLPDTDPTLPELETIVMVPLPRPNPESVRRKLMERDRVQLQARSGDPSAGLPTWEDVQRRSYDIAGWVHDHLFGVLGLHTRARTIHFPVDDTFMNDDPWSVTHQIYCTALLHTELVAYIDLDGFYDTETKEYDYMRYDFSPLEQFRYVGGFKSWWQPATRERTKCIVLVGTASGVRQVYGDDYEETCKLGWTWLGPDGKRRDPIEAIGMELDEEEQ